MLIFEEFGGSVWGRPAERVKMFVRLAVGAETEVANFDKSRCCVKDVFCLKVTVYDVVGMLGKKKRKNKKAKRLSDCLMLIDLKLHCKILNHGLPDTVLKNN